MVKLTDEELKEQIRKHIKKEKEDKADQERYATLRAAVELENEWEFWASTKLHRQNLQRWLKEWAFDNPKTYQEMVKEQKMPPVSEQRDNPPENYERYYGFDYTDRTYRTLEEKEDMKKSARFAKLILGGVAIIGIGIIIYLVVF